MSGKTREISKIKEIGDRVTIVQPNAHDHWRMEIEKELDELLKKRHGLEHPGQTWPLIHSVEERVNAHDNDLQYLACKVGHHLANEAGRTRKITEAHFEKLLKEVVPDQQDPKTRAALEEARKIISDSHNRDSSTYESARKTRAGLAWGSGGLVVIAIAAVIAQALSPEAFVPLPQGSTLNASLFLVLLLGAGALGGILSAMFSLYLTKQVEDRSWYDPRPALTWTKVTVGAWASVIAAVAVGTGALVGEYTSLAAALLIGVAFGYAQQAVTGLLDKYAVGMTEKDPAKA